ncbi:MAG: DUF4105 domain-containing protein [Spirochaetes bacterium]|nr:DUF4105 domain-containing protein [Spirochaetota bacterium]
MRKKAAITALLIFALALAPSPARAQGGENLTLSIALLGPGTELFFWWGHISLLVEDSLTGRATFFDYGIFSFETENFFTNFAMGRLIFSTGSFDANMYVHSYIMSNRDVIFFNLDLPPQTRLEIYEFVQNSVLPENRYYYYHHFFDNCSTRLRDIIDIATGGQFREQFGEAPSRFTLRQHVRRHTWFSPFFDWLLNFLMGQRIDTPITVWDDMFLPSELARRIQEFYYTDSEGNRRQLVSGTEVIFLASDRPEVLEDAPVQWPRKLVFSLCVSALVLLFSFLQARKKRIGRVLLGATYSAAGFVFGSAGLLLYFMAIFTDHDYTFDNINMLFGTPLLLAAIPLGIRYARSKDLSAKKFLKTSFYLRALWLLCALGVIASMLIKLLPQFWQDNLPDQMLMLPLALAFALHPAGLKKLLAGRKKYLKRK